MASVTISLSVLLVVCTMAVTHAQVEIDANAAIANVGNITVDACKAELTKCFDSKKAWYQLLRKNLPACVGVVIDEKNGDCDLVKAGGCTAERLQKVKDNCDELSDRFYKKLVDLPGSCQRAVSECIGNGHSNIISAIRSKDKCDDSFRDISIKSWDCVKTASAEITTPCTSQEHEELVAVLKPENCTVSDPNNSGQSGYAVSMVTVVFALTMCFVSRLIL